MSRRITVSLDDKIVEAIQSLSLDLETFIVAAVEQEITRHQQLAALREVAGLWHDRDDIPDTPEDLVRFVRQMRAEAERPQ